MSERTRIRPTRRALSLFVGSLALFAVGANVQAGWVLAVAALLAGLLFAGALLAVRGLSGIEVARRGPRAATAGDVMLATLSISNTGTRLRGLISASDDFCGTAGAIVRWIAPGQTREFSTERAELERGVYAGGPCVLETGAPFGVLRVRRACQVATPLVVYPKTYDVSAVQLLGLTGWRASAMVGDISSVRDYRPGDPLRHIHWRSVARRGRLVVREFDVGRHSDLVIVAEGDADRDITDAIASIAASFAVATINSGDEVRLLSARDGRVHGARPHDAEDALDWGARLESADVPPTSVIDGVPGAETVVCVCPAASSSIGRLCELASGANVIVVLVGEGQNSTERLRAAGARAALVPPDGVETWFASGCAVS